ncbi:MAG: hypothetical protein ACLFUE_00930 [Desulfobacteraceae bacterium]
MIVLPKEEPVIQGINSYYTDPRRLIEHYQGELGAGAVHFLAPSAEGAIFFDKDEILGGVYRQKETEANGVEAAELMIEATAGINFKLDVYAVDPGQIHFWANISGAETVYRDLTTEFTDLEGLIKKMTSEGLTGYIEVSVHGGRDGGLIFFMNGEIIGGSYSWLQGEVNGTDQARETLLRMSKDRGGTFHVSRIPPQGEEHRPEPEKAPDREIIQTLQELLALSERVMEGGKFTPRDFRTSLKRKLMEKADQYPFLDPFAGELDYADGSLTFSGTAPADQLLEGLTQAIKELALDVGAWSRLSQEIPPWKEKNSELLSRLGTSSI